MKRYLRWIVAAEFLFAAGNLHAVEVEVPGLLTDHTASSIGHDFYRAFSDKWESDYTFPFITKGSVKIMANR